MIQSTDVLIPLFPKPWSLNYDLFLTKVFSFPFSAKEVKIGSRHIGKKIKKVIQRDNVQFKAITSSSSKPLQSSLSRPNPSSQSSGHHPSTNPANSRLTPSPNSMLSGNTSRSAPPKAPGHNILRTTGMSGKPTPGVVNKPYK